MSLRKPKALLIIYQPQHRFRFKKYFLAQGKNSIGCSPTSNVRISNIQNQLPNDVAVIFIGQYLMTLQSTSGQVKVMSNMLNKKLAVPLPRGKQFVVEMEKQFFLGNFKCFVQILPFQQLKLVKNVENQAAFTFDTIYFSQGYGTQRKPYNKFSQQADVSFYKSQKIVQKNKMELQNQQPQSPKSNLTEKIPEQGGFQPTLQIDDYGGFSPTIQINEDFEMFPSQKKERQLSQQKQSLISQQKHQKNLTFSNGKAKMLNKSNQKSTYQSLELFGVANKEAKVQISSQQYKQIRMQQKKLKLDSVPNKTSKTVVNPVVNPSLQNDSEQISMPETLNQDQMPPTIQDPQDDQMPPTIQQGEPQDKLKAMIKSEAHLSKTVPLNSMNEVPTQSALRFKSWEPARIIKRKQQPTKQIQDFCDMFGVSSTEKKNDSKKMEFQKPKQQLENKEQASNLEKTQKTQNTNQDKSEQGYYKLHRLKKHSNNSGKIQNDKVLQLPVSKKNQSQANDEGLQKKQPLKKVAFSNMKVSEFTKKKLKDRGYIAITGPEQDYDLLLIGNELKRSTRLLCALLLGKQIKNQAWLYNSSVKITGKLQGFLWENIQKTKGRQGKIFNGRYYLSPRLRQQFQTVVQLGGATLVQDLTKARTNQDLSLIISVLDKQIYDKKKNYKRWNIYSQKMIIQSVLVGQEIKQKYLMDDFSFV